jgi:fused signal recognition particle receptor
MTTSASAGQCQKIDRQQREQIIRKPPAEQAKEADLAKLEQDIRKLADAQKKFAESVDPKTGPGAKLDRQNEPKTSQAASSKEAGRLNSLAKQDKALTDLAKSRMEEAAKSVEKSNQAIQAEQAQEAAKDARVAAEQLERLAEQVAALKAEELADRIGKARDLARTTAKVQRDLAGRGPEPKPQAAQEQQALAENARTLADLLKRAQADATDEDRTLAQALEKANQSHSPGEIEQAMRQASAEIEAGQPGKSTRSMKQAEAQLDGLATDLETARRAFTQPKLQQLLAAEKQAAETQKALGSANSEARKAEAEKALGELAKTLQSLKSGDAALRQAADNLAKLGQPSGTDTWTAPQKNGTRTGLYKPPIAYTKGVGEATQALQARIQALIVNDALVDRDGPVPPAYKSKVEDYFRVLSEDLR